MSATIDAELFATYFQPVLSAPPPFVTIPGRAFPVDCLYLEDLMERTDTHIERGSMYAKRSVRGGGTTQLKLKDKDGVKQSQTFDLYDDDEAYKDSIDVDDVYRGYGDRTRVSMWRVDESTINYDLIVTVVGSLVDKFSAGDGAVLIFLPGMAEIKKLNGMLTAFGDLHVLPLHSSLPPAANKEAFKSAPRGKRKVILSTNIAETSITISDVVVVVDTGLEREISMDRRGISRLMVKWCSRSSVKQRQGRAGRVQQGLCLKLFSRHTYLHKMNENTVPELQRVPIGEVCMQVLGGASGEGEEVSASHATHAARFLRPSRSFVAANPCTDRLLEVPVERAATAQARASRRRDQGAYVRGRRCDQPEIPQAVPDEARAAPVEARRGGAGGQGAALLHPLRVRREGADGGRRYEHRQESVPERLRGRGRGREEGRSEKVRGRGQ